MIEFKKNVKKLLPYDRKKYKNFLAKDNTKDLDNSLNHEKWFGVSFQLPGVYDGLDIGLPKFLETYVDWVKNIISQLDTGSTWIVNHPFADRDWLPNNEQTLIRLRNLFKERNIPNAYRGAIIFTKQDLFEYINEIISYPYAVFDEKGIYYLDLDISHSELPFVIKTSSHLNMDLLSTDRKLLKKVVKENSPSEFIKFYYWYRKF